MRLFCTFGRPQNGTKIGLNQRSPTILPERLIQMDTTDNSVPGFDDILFHARNKEYGAYQLRKNYSSTVIAGIIVSSIIGFALVLIPLILVDPAEHIIAGGGRNVSLNMENLKPPEEQIYVPPVQPPPAKNLQEAVRYVPPVIVDSMPPLSQKLVSNDEALQNIETEQIENAGGYGDESLVEGSGSGDGEPFLLAEVMPSFRGGGLDKFREWVVKRTNYPQEAIDKKIKGTVVISFVVERDGMVSNVNVLKGVNPILDKEVVLTVSESPKWSPGLQRGRPVRFRYLLPVNFQF